MRNLEEIAAAREKIDEEIKSLEERIHFLRYTRNNLAPISQIPAEVLAQIFRYVQHAWTGRDDLPSDFLKWLAILRVSRDWRMVALGCASLWSTFPVSSSYDVKVPIETALKSSKESPLCLFVDVYDQEILYAEKILSCFPRIQHLRFSRDATRRVSLTFSDVLAQPTPLLESFSTNHTPLLESFSSNARTNQGFYIPDNFLAGDAPLLRYLHFVNCSFQWSVFHLGFQNVTDLAIIEPIRQASPDVIANALRTLPNLTSVVLESVVGEEEISNTLPLHSIHLPKLLRFSLRELETGIEVLQEFISYFRFNADTRINFQADPVEMDEMMFSTILSFLLETLPSNPVVRRMEFNGKSLISFKLWNNPSDEPFLMVKLYEDAPHSPPYWIEGSWFAGLHHCTALPLDNVELLSVYGDIKKDVWLETLPRLSNISQLDLHGHCAEDLITCLVDEFLAQSTDSFSKGRRPVASSSSSTQSSIPLLPRLKHLELYNFDLESDKADTLFSEMLAARRQNGVGLVTLTMCRFTGLNQDGVQRWISESVDTVETSLGRPRHIDYASESESGTDSDEEDE